MFKKLNESFHRMFLREAASDENTVENDVIKSLERNLREVALTKLSHGITNIKDYEYAFQDTIESFFPARAWWEVTDCNIFWTLFETKSTDDTIDEIIKGIKPEFRGEYKSEEIIEIKDDADVEAEKAINAREAEYGADGKRVFRDDTDFDIKESKSLEESPQYELSPEYDNRKSFYRKAIVNTDSGKDKLYSYNTLVAEMTDKGPVVYGIYSQTTLRHIKEWLRQHGFEATSKDQIIRDYVVKNESLKESVSSDEFKIDDVVKTIDWLYHHNKNYTKEQYYKISDIYDFFFEPNGSRKKINIQERNLTRSERYNRDMNRIFDFKREQDDKFAEFLKKNGYSDEQIDDLRNKDKLSFEIAQKFTPKGKQPSEILNKIIYEITVESKKHTNVKSLRESANQFDVMSFEKKIPTKMRFKKYDEVNDNDLYWVTQEFFDEDDIKKFAVEFKNTGFDKAYVTVRDLSSYDFDKDSTRNVFVVVNKDGSYDMSDYGAHYSERFGIKESTDVTDQVVVDIDQPGFITRKKELQDKGYKVIWTGNRKICLAKPNRIGESKKSRSKKSLKESYDVYDMCDAGTVTIYDGYSDDEAGDGYWVALNHPEEDFGEYEVDCYETINQAKEAAEYAMELIRKAQDTGEIGMIFDYNTSDVLSRIANRVCRKFPGSESNYYNRIGESKKLHSKSLKEYKNESLKESTSEDDDKPYSYREMEKELKDNGVFDKDKGSFSVGFEEEKEHCKKILRRHGYKFEVSGDDRTTPPRFHFEYWKDEKKPVKEDTVKQGDKWVNKGKEGTHGKFRTKKEADAQRKAMFAQGYKGESLEKPKHIANEAFGDDMRVYMNTWANYNEYGADLSQYGINSLKDGWMTIDQALEFCEEHAEDEPFINDTDNIPSGLDINEYSDAVETLEKLQELEGLDIDDDLLDALTEATGSIDDAIDVYESGDYEWYPGISSYTDLAYEVIEQLGGLKYAVSDITNYIDENAMRRDYEYDVRDMMYDDAEYEVEKEHRLDDEDEYDKDQEIEDWIDNNIDSYLDSIISEEIGLAEMGEVDLSDYFDYEAYGRDLSFDDYYIANTGAIRVF